MKTFRSALGALGWYWERIEAGGSVVKYVARLTEGGNSYTSPREDELALMCDISICFDRLSEVEKWALILSYQVRRSQDEIAQILRRRGYGRWHQRKVSRMISKALGALEKAMVCRGIVRVE